MYLYYIANTYSKYFQTPSRIEKFNLIHKRLKSHRIFLNCNKSNILTIFLPITIFA